MIDAVQEKFIIPDCNDSTREQGVCINYSNHDQPHEYTGEYGESRTENFEWQVKGEEQGRYGVFTIVNSTAPEVADVDSEKELVSVVKEKFIIGDCPDRPMCINTTEYDQPHVYQGSIKENFNESYTWKVNATGRGGQYAVFSIANSTLEKVEETESNKQVVDIRYQSVSFSENDTVTVQSTGNIGEIPNYFQLQSNSVQANGFTTTSIELLRDIGQSIYIQLLPDGARSKIENPVQSITTSSIVENTVDIFSSNSEGLITNQDIKETVEWTSKVQQNSTLNTLIADNWHPYNTAKESLYTKQSVSDEVEFLRTVIEDPKAVSNTDRELKSARLVSQTAQLMLNPDETDKFIIQDCPDRPMCINTDNYDQPHRFEGSLDNQSYKWEVYGYRPGNYSVFSIANSTMEGVEETESNTENIEIQKIDGFTQDHLENITDESEADRIVEVLRNPEDSFKVKTSGKEDPSLFEAFSKSIGIDSLFSNNASLLEKSNSITSNIGLSTVGTPNFISDIVQTPIIGDTLDTFIDIDRNTREQLTTDNTAIDTVRFIADVIQLDALFGFNQEENVQPDINNVQLAMNDLGGENTLKMTVNITDPDGNSDRRYLEYDGKTKYINTTDDKVELNIEGDLQADSTVKVNDSVGHVKTLDIAYNITDKNWEQNEETVDVDQQRISKTDTIRNTGGNSFDYEMSHETFTDRTSQTFQADVVTGRLQAGNSSTWTTDIQGNYIKDEIGEWTQDDNLQSTEDTQFIRKSLSLEDVVDVTWENVVIPDVQNPEGFEECDNCDGEQIETFRSSFEDKRYYQDTGDIITREDQGTIEEFVIGERDTFFEQFEYIQVEQGVNLTQIQVDEEIDDSQTDYGGYMTVAERPNTTWTNRTDEVPEQIDCDTGNPTLEDASFNNNTFSSCSKDINGNERSDYFKTIIANPQYEKPITIRFGGFRGDSPTVESEPFAGLIEDCETGETYGDLECLRNEWRPASETERTSTIIDQELGQFAEGLGLLLMLILVMGYLGIRNKGGKNQ